MFRHQNWGSVLWISVTWIQRTAVLRFLVCLKGRMTSDACKCTSLKVSFVTSGPKERSKRDCSVARAYNHRHDQDEMRDPWRSSEPWIRSRPGSGLGLCQTVIRDKDLSFSLPNVKLDGKPRSSEMRLYVTVVYYKCKAFFWLAVIHDLVRRESNVCIWSRSVIQWRHTLRFLYM